MTGRKWKGSAFGGARGRTDVPKIVDWYMEGKINIDDLITHTLPLERHQRGLRADEARRVDPLGGGVLTWPEVRTSLQMAELKTKPTKVSVEKHIAAIANEEQRNDAQALIALMRRVAKQEPRMWGPSIVGSGDSALTGFAVRRSEFAIYILAGFDGKNLLAKLGKHKAANRACTSNACPTWISRYSRGWLHIQWKR